MRSAIKRRAGANAAPQPEISRRGRWFFVDTAGPRARRPVDVLIVVTGVFLFAASARRADQQGLLERAIVDALSAMPRWSLDVFAIAYAVGGLYALGAVAVVVRGARRRRPLVRDIAIAAPAALLLVVAAAWLVERAWPQIASELLSADPVNRFPATRVALVTAVLLTLRPYVVRPFRRLSGSIVAVEALAAAGFGVGGPADVLGALGLGLVASGAVLVAFGSPGGHPDLSEVDGALAELGITVRGLRFAENQSWGVRLLHAERPDGRPLLIKVYGRDASDVQFFARAWRTLIYRDAGPRLRGTRLQLVEHEALVTLLARRAGVTGAEVVAAATAGSDDAVLVLDRPGLPERDGRPGDLTGDVPDPVLVACWRAVGRLHTAGISHGRLTMERLAPSGGDVAVTEYESGSLAASAARRAGDVANLLVSQAAGVGVSRAVDAALTGLGRDGLVDALPYLQVAALTTELRRIGKLKQLVGRLRAEVAERTETVLPPPARVVRVRLRDLLVTGLLVLAAYGLITNLADVNWSEVVDGWKTANWWWVLLAFPIAQTTVLSDAVSTMSAVLPPLAYGPLVVLHVAIKFVGLAIPGPAGRLATTASFLRRFGVGPTQAVTSSALDTMAGVLVQAAVLLLVVLFGDTSFHVRGDAKADWATLVWIVAGAVAVSVLALAAIPALRQWIRRTGGDAWRAMFFVVRSPSRIILLIASNLVSQLIYAVTMWCTVNAFHLSISPATLLVVVAAAGLLAGLIPVPGNVGVAEAALTAGLLWAGVPQATGFAIAVTYRICTFYLPPIFGVFGMRWLSARSYIG